MSHTVGIVGVNGNVGKKALPHLAKAARDGKIKLVVFHRQNSSLQGIENGENIEFRVIDLNGAAESIEQAVKGVNIFVSAMGFEGLAQEPAVVDALAKSSDCVTYIPSTYSLHWTKEDAEDRQLGPFLKFVHMGRDRATELGLGLTSIYSSIFDVYWFAHGFLESSLKSGEIVANEKQLQNRLPITSLEHLGQTIAHVATSDPNSVKNRDFYCVTFSPTGKELVELHTRITGKTPAIKDYSSAFREEQLAAPGGAGAAKVGYWDRWANDSFSFGQSGQFEYRGPGLEEVGKQFL